MLPAKFPSDCCCINFNLLLRVSVDIRYNPSCMDSIDIVSYVCTFDHFQSLYLVYRCCCSCYLFRDIPIEIHAVFGDTVASFTETYTRISFCCLTPCLLSVDCRASNNQTPKTLLNNSFNFYFILLNAVFGRTRTIYCVHSRYGVHNKCRTKAG